MRVYKVLVVGVCVVLGTSAIDAQRRGRRPRGPEASPVLEAVTALTCVFPASASGSWTNGQPSAAVASPAGATTMRLSEVDAQGGTAIAAGLGETAEVTVRLVGSNLHFLDIRPSGALAVTTVFSEVSHDGRLKAVQSRSEYGGTRGGGTAGPPAVSQHYGDCEIGK
ncbi:MAG: hypothetical protein ABL986_01970 [Vicinamibacterales bacterium]